MRRIIHLLLLAFLHLASHAQGGGPQYQAYYHSQEAEKLIESKSYPEAIRHLDLALEFDRDNVSYQVRKAQVLGLSGNHAASAEVAKPILKHKKCSPQAYQVYGNALDLLGKSDEALGVYQEGLKRFPGTGFLWMEMGILEYARKRDSIAKGHWLKGIEEDYDFPNNYYWLAHLEAEQGDWLHAMMHAEIFMNLDRQVSDRTKEMSRVIFDAYRKTFKISHSGRPYFDLLSRGEKGMTNSPQTLEEAIQTAYNYAIPDSVKDLKISHLPGLRARFRDEWKKQYATRFEHPLWKWMDILRSDGHETAYTWWLLYDADPSAFMSWYEPNEKTYYAFEIWYIRKPLSMYLPEPKSAGRKTN